MEPEDPSAITVGAGRAVPLFNTTVAESRVPDASRFTRDGASGTTTEASAHRIRGIAFSRW